MDRTRLTRKTLTEGAFASFGGIDFDVQGDPEACERVVRAAGGGAISGVPGTAADTLAPKFAASCRLQLLPAAGCDRPAPPRPGIRWQWDAGGGELVTRLGAARVEESADRQFVGSGWLSDDVAAPHFLLSGLTAMLAHRLGGGILHAASVEMDGQAIAFIGPSGAGKSTACLHVEGAPLFAVDRLAIVPLPVLRAPKGSDAPHPGSATSGAASADPVWFAHPLPGGTRPVPDMRSALPRWLPLGGVLRVERAASDTSIVAPSLAGAVTVLRQSTLMVGLGPHVEHELLSRLEDLARRRPVARLQLRLGASLAPLLRRWLVDPGNDRG